MSSVSRVRDAWRFRDRVGGSSDRGVRTGESEDMIEKGVRMMVSLEQLAARVTCDVSSEERWNWQVDRRGQKVGQKVGA